jgi:phospholipase/carboxylesterase
MMDLSFDLILQQPADADGAELILLFHGVGSSAEDLRPLGQVLASARPRAWVISVRSPDRSDFGSGWQWFSVQGVTAANRPCRVAAAMPAFWARVGAWQKHTGVGPERTTLIGFSQGAIMALESMQCPEPQPLAGRVVAIAGRFAQSPHRASKGVAVHLLHGDEDRVMPVGLAVEGHTALQHLGIAATLDRFPGLGHGVDGRVVEALLRRTADMIDKGTS